MAANRQIGMSRRVIPADAAGNPILYDARNRPINPNSEQQAIYLGREPGPGIPLKPFLPRGEEPRQWFPFSGENLNWIPRSEVSELTPFATLRNLADTSDIVRLAIEDVIQQVVALDWDIHPVDEDADAKAMRPQIDRVKNFLKRPDREHSFKRWLTMLLEDCLVIDALTFYRQRTISGEPYALIPIDGASIKPVVDYRGRAPEPPATAYQQYGAGRIETEFHRPYLDRESLEAAILEGIQDPEKMPVELIYAPRKPRVFTPYGQSPVERVIITVNLALRRQLHYLAFYTDGNIPEAFWKCPENWEPTHIEHMQDTFEKMLSGESGLRRRLRFMPGGEGAGLENPRGDDEWKKEFDEYLARIVCYAFNTSPLPLVQLMNRATSETQEAAATHSGSHPIMDFVHEFMTREVQEFLGEPDLEFIWTEDKERDERLFMEKSGVFVSRGIYTRNEVRDIEGREPIEGGDVATVDTASGPVPLADFVLGGLPPAGNGGGTVPGRNPLDVPLPPAAGGEAEAAAPSPASDAASALEVALPALAGKAQRTEKGSEGFDPNQPRDEGGQWSETGAGEGGAEAEATEDEDEGEEEEEDVDQTDPDDPGAWDFDEDRMKELGMDEKDEIRVIDWVRADDEKDFKSMRNPTTEIGAEYEKTLDKMEVYEGEAYRGMVLFKDKAELLAGQEEVSLALNSSASIDEDVAKTFAGEGGQYMSKVSVLIKVKTKSAANLAEIAPPIYQHEQEIVLRAGTTYKQRVLDYDPKKNRLSLEWEEAA